MYVEKIYVTLCPYCFGPAWPTAIDVDGTVLAMQCYECLYEAEPWNFLNDHFEIKEETGNELKPRHRKLSIAESVLIDWKN